MLLQIVFYTFSQKNSIFPTLPTDNNTPPFYRSFFTLFLKKIHFSQKISILPILPTDNNTLPFYRSIFPLFPKKNHFSQKKIHFVNSTHRQQYPTTYLTMPLSIIMSICTYPHTTIPFHIPNNATSKIVSIHII